MTTRQHRYSFQEIPAFDAKKDMQRCAVLGVGMSFATSGRHANASDADFWRHRDGAIMVRISWMGYAWSFRALLASGEPIPEEAAALAHFADCVQQELYRWMTEDAADMPPFDD